MARLRRLVFRLFILLVILGLAALVGVGWIGSERLVSPPRRTLQNYHHQILENPAGHGLSITHFTGAGATPCLLARPASIPGRATKSRQLRQGLQSRGIDPGPWGSIHGTVILLHGHGSRKEDHLPIAERFCAAGFRCLMPDLPGHGDHPDQLATFGLREVDLLEALVDDAEITFGFDGGPLFLFGVSQGGAIALQTAAQHPERWTAVVSVAAFSRLDLPLIRGAESLHPRLRPIAPVNVFSVSCGSWLRSGLLPSRINPRHAATHLTMPVMVVHGTNDRFIPIDQGREIFDALPASPHHVFRPVSGAGHGRVLAHDGSRLYPEVAAFLRRSLHEPNQRTAAR